MSRDNWERLVATVLKREQLWQLFHQQSRSPSNISTSSSDFTDEQIFRKIKYGYSMVYRGLLENGRHVAVKRYRKRGNQNAEEKFMEEVQKNSIALHPCILNMVGLCTTANENLLVYPLMINGSVESCLRGRQKSQPPLDWPTRKRIAVGVARGLAYLHHECERKIIHRDIKAANILLDEDFEAVIGDLELAIIMDDNTTSYSSTSLVGTIGHIISPHNYTTYTWSQRSDVLCYGVFLLELFTGLRVFDLARIANGEDMKLLDWIKRKYMKRKWMNMVDADCGGNYKNEVVEQLMQIALICTQTSPHECPNMLQVVTMLEIGHGLSERWQDWYKKEAAEIKENDHVVDDDMVEEQLSGPR